MEDHSTSLILILLFCNFFFSSKSVDNTSFIFHGFNDSDLIRDGAAVIRTGSIKLTNRLQNVIGHAFYPTPILIDPNASSFSTNFVFHIVPSTVNRGGFGLAFILSPSPSFPGAAAELYLGVFNKYNDGNRTNHVFMVEFDTVNGYNSKTDTDGNHVGINLNGMNSEADRSAEYHVTGTVGNNEEFSLERDGPIRAWIDYYGVNKVVNVTVAPLDIPKPEKPLISETINLSDVLVKRMYAGFSAATGQKSSSHYILGWSFRLLKITDICL